MLSSLKRMFVVIPCMIFGLFLFNGVEVSATEATLVEATKVVVGEESAENTYYFTNSTNWNMQINDYNIWNPSSPDTSLTYRVVKPDGSATGWSKQIRYPDSGGKFTINIEGLSFSEQEDITTRNSVAKGATYYVDVKYYSSVLFGAFPKDQNKDETIKVVYNDNSNFALYTPVVDVNYDDSANHYTVNASIVDTSNNNVGIGVITSVKYFYSTVKVENYNDEEVFSNAYREAELSSLLQFVPNCVIENLVIEDTTGEETYLYVWVESGNGYYAVKEIDNTVKVEEGTQEGEKDKTPTTNTGDSDTGLFDYDFGEFILLVLVIVLIVSCALIITQKIVDYKKRLY